MESSFFTRISNLTSEYFGGILNYSGFSRLRLPSGFSIGGGFRYGGNDGEEDDNGLFEYLIFKKYGKFYVKRGLISGSAVYSNRVKKDTRGIEVMPLSTADVEDMVSETALCDRPPIRGKGLIPVVFVHGYSSTVLGMGGGKHTWGSLPYLLDNKKYMLTEFRWRTAQRFQDAADSLGELANFLYESTGNRVHIVAHSFGGLLARTYIQGLAEKTAYQNDVDSVVTFGTPHSGISDSVCRRFGRVLPIGQFFDLSITAQISGYQAGLDLNEMRSSKIFATEAEPGYIPAMLCDFENHPIPDGVRMLSVIGLSNKDMTDEVEDGDRVISYAGQRFAPQLTLGGREPLLKEYGGFGGNVTEIIMGAGNADVRPGEHFIFHPDVNGYVHSPLIKKNKASEVFVKCRPDGFCSHPAYVIVKNWLEK